MVVQSHSGQTAFGLFTSLLRQCYNYHVPLTVVQEASYCQKSETRFWTGPATSAFQRCGRSSSWSQTWPWDLWKKQLRHRRENGLGREWSQGVRAKSYFSDIKRPPYWRPTYLVRTSNLHLLMMRESSNKMGNQPRTQTLSPGATFISSLVYSCSTYDKSHSSEEKTAKELRKDWGLTCSQFTIQGTPGNPTETVRDNHCAQGPDAASPWTHTLL